MTRREVVSLIILLVVLGYGAWKFINRTFRETRTQANVLNTMVTISASSKSKNIGAQIDSVFAFIKELETKFNDYDPQSWVSRLNASEGKAFPMDPDVYPLFEIADSLHRMTAGAFDITIKPLYDLWGFSDSLGVVADTLVQVPPDSLQIVETKARIGFERVRYNQQQVILPAGMQISFGALAKGYVLDRAVAYMKSIGLLSGYIDCTSSMVFFNQKLGQIVHVQHPRPTQNQGTIGNFKIKNAALSTSGDYQLYFDFEGTRYHHILDPHTGYPVPDVFSVTVIHPTAVWADGLSTALFLMSPEQAIEAVKQIPGANAVIFYQSENEIVSIKTQGMKDLEWRDE